jgi:hypothetical protein
MASTVISHLGTLIPTEYLRPSSPTQLKPERLHYQENPHWPLWAPLLVPRVSDGHTPPDLFRDL